jgi:hypothetical protein
VLADRGWRSRRLGVRLSDTAWPTSSMRPSAVFDTLGDPEMLDLRVGEDLIDRID